MSSSYDRRAAIRHGLTASASLLFAPSVLSALETRLQSSRPWLAAALKAERWLATTAQHGPNGITWPTDPTRPSSVSTDLYTGMAGIVLFYLELHNATKDEQALKMARGGADYLLWSLPDEPGQADVGLYTGLAGTAIVLEHAYVATSDERYLRGVQRILLMLSRSARPTGLGVEWNESTDIISGSAGIGLTLLALRDRTRDFATWELAARAGDRLIERSQRVDANKRTWLISPQMPRNYPNFSHGTAGVAFFLTRLYGSSGARMHLDAALAGERWLASITSVDAGGGRKVYHSTPGNEQIYYLSWCHGPAGTARLYRALGAVTRDGDFDRRVNELALATRNMKVPERSPGFWNNISQCCGNCGVSEFYVSLHRRTGDAGHLAFAEEIARDTIARGTAEGEGTKWVQAEHRVRPELLVAQTGLMQGAAGVGLAMLHLDGAREGRKQLVRLPDDPF